MRRRGWLPPLPHRYRDDRKYCEIPDEADVASEVVVALDTLRKDDHWWPGQHGEGALRTLLHSRQVAREAKERSLRSYDGIAPSPYSLASPVWLSIRATTLMRPYLLATLHLAKISAYWARHHTCRRSCVRNNEPRAFDDINNRQEQHLKGGRVRLPARCMPL